MVDLTGYVRGAGAPDAQSTASAMRSARRWLVWKLGPVTIPGKKRAKKPFYASGQPRGETDGPEDLSRLVTYEEAKAVMDRSGGVYQGLGFALGMDGGVLEDGTPGAWQGIDNDAGLAGMEDFPGLVEKSPSGGGYHVIGYGRPFMSKADHERGREVYASGRFFTVTFDVVKDGPVTDLYDIAGTGPLPEPGARVEHPVEDLTEEQLRDLRGALRVISPDGYTEWMQVCLALRNVRGGEEIFHEWARGSGKYDQAENDKKFRTVGQPVCHWRSIFNWAKSTGQWPPKSGLPTLLEQEVVDTSSAPWVEYVLKDFIPAGTLVVGGMYGVGKTSQILSLVLRACGCYKARDQWRPDLRRRVVYFTESMTQTRRLLYAARQEGLLGVNDAELAQWLRFYPTQSRMPVRFWEEQLKALREDMAVDQEMADGGPPVRVYPLFVIDTIPNLVVINQENDNSEIANIVASIRGAVGAASCWLVTHLSKALRDADPDAYSARGASAWGAGTDGEVFVFSNVEDPEDPARYVRLGKDRVGVEHRQVRIDTVKHEGRTSWRGLTEKFTTYLGGEMTPYSEGERREQKQRARSARQEDDLRARMMVMMTRAKRALESCEGEGLAVARTAGRAQPPPGYARWSLEDVMMGKRTSEVRGELVAALVEAYCPVEEEHFYLFKKPAFGMGKK